MKETTRIFILFLFVFLSASHALPQDSPQTARKVFISVNNASVTGTTRWRLAKLTGAPSTAVIVATTDVDGAIGIVVKNGGTSLAATIQTQGQAACDFDGATTAGDYVQISSSSAGKCHDTGSSSYPASGQVLGRVLSTNGGSGNYQMLLYLSTSGHVFGGTVTTVTASAPITSSGGATPNISCSTCVTASSPTFTGTLSAATVEFTDSWGANYTWNTWSPSDLIGTYTNAPGTTASSSSSATFYTLSNSSGTLTITFKVAGKYMVAVTMKNTHANVYSHNTMQAVYGGTATNSSQTSLSDAGDAANSEDSTATDTLFITATANQTLTILPKGRIVAGAGTTANHTFYAQANVVYMGG